MNKKKLLALLLCLTVVFAFASCGGAAGEDENSGPTMAEEANTELDESKAPTKENKAYGELSKELKDYWQGQSGYQNLSVGGVGDTLKNDFFDWTVNSVRTETALNGRNAASGKKFVVININMTNTEDTSYETGNYEFWGLIGQGEPLNTLDAFYDGMIPDTVKFAPGQTLSGDIVYEVDKNLDKLIVDYDEVYGDESTGNAYWFELKL